MSGTGELGILTSWSGGFLTPDRTRLRTLPVGLAALGHLHRGGFWETISSVPRCSPVAFSQSVPAAFRVTLISAALDETGEILVTRVKKSRFTEIQEGKF